MTEPPIFLCARSLGGKRGREHKSCPIALCMVAHNGQNYSSGSADLLATAAERHSVWRGRSLPPQDLSAPPLPLFPLSRSYWMKACYISSHQPSNSTNAQAEIQEALKGAKESQLEDQSGNSSPHMLILYGARRAHNTGVPWGHPWVFTRSPAKELSLSRAGSWRDLPLIH